MALHASHPDIVKRLKRAHGHLRNVIEMIEGGRPCLELAQQLHAVEKAITAAKKELIHDHIENCVEDGGGGRAALKEVKQLTKYL